MDVVRSERRASSAVLRGDVGRWGAAGGESRDEAISHSIETGPATIEENIRLMLDDQQWMRFGRSVTRKV